MSAALPKPNWMGAAQKGYGVFAVTDDIGLLGCELQAPP